MKYKKVLFEEVGVFTTGKLNSNAAIDNGRYAFFTCAPNPLRTNTYSFDQEAILLAGNNAEANFHINIYKGKFDVYQRTYVIDTLDSEKMDLHFLYYALKMNLGYFKMLAKGSSTKFLTAKIINSFEIPYCPIDEQRKIAYLLKGFDDKIELNNRINKNLEQQAVTIFKQYCDSGKGKTKILGDFCSFAKGKKPLELSDSTSAGFDLYLTIDALTTGAKQFATVEKSIIASSTDILMVMDGASSGLILYGKSGVLGSTLARIDVTNEYIREIIRYFLIYRADDIKSHNTGSTIPHADKKYILQMPIFIPNDFETIGSILISFRDKIIANKSENEHLCSLRNTLLPKLMTGEIDVSDLQL